MCKTALAMTKMLSAFLLIRHQLPHLRQQTFFICQTWIHAHCIRSSLSTSLKMTRRFHGSPGLALKNKLEFAYNPLRQLR